MFETFKSNNICFIRTPVLWRKWQLEESSCPHFKICSITPIFTKSQTGINWLTFKLKMPLFVQNSTYVVQILCSLSYRVWSTFITKFRTTNFLILTRDIPVIIHQHLVTVLWQQQPCDMEALWDNQIALMSKLRKNRQNKISGNKVSIAKLSMTVSELSPYIFVVHMFWLSSFIIILIIIKIELSNINLLNCLKNGVNFLVLINGKMMVYLKISEHIGN